MKKLAAPITLLLLGTYTAHAQEVIYKLAAPLPGGEETVSNFTDYAQFLFPFMLSIASILALTMFTIGAIQYMFSDGGAGNKDGKDKMTSAIFGILLAAGSVLLLETINPKLITLTIDIEQRNGYGNPGPGPTPAGGFLLGALGKEPPQTSEVATITPCGNDSYGICPSQNACIKNPIGDYYCAKISRAVCPTGTECTPCSQTQLEQCIKNNPHTTSCAIARTPSGNTTLCSNE